MNKQELVNQVAEQADLPKNKAQAAVEAIFDCIKSTLASGSDMRLVGFGTFSVKDRPAGTARNPRTGETMQVAASKRPKFTAGKELKDACNTVKAKKKAA